MKPLVSILLIIFVTSGICSCKSVVVAEKETTTVTVHERDVPVFTPEVNVNARGKIWIDHNGFPRLGDVSITTDSDKPQPKKPKVSVELDSLGNLKIDVAIPEDTTHVSVSDTTRQTDRLNTRYVEVEKDNPWWKKSLMFVGIVTCIVIFFVLFKKRHSLF